MLVKTHPVARGRAAANQYTNLAPVWTTVPTIQFTEGTGGNSSIASYCTDPNAGETLTFAVASGSLPSGITLSSAGVYQYSGVGGAATGSIAVRAMDNGTPNLSADSNSHTVQILSNLAWTGTPSTTFTEGVAAQVNLGAYVAGYSSSTDVFSISGNPAWLTLTGTGGVLLTADGTQTDGGAGDGATINIGVSRSGGAYVYTGSLTVTVNPDLAGTDWVPNIVYQLDNAHNLPPAKTKHTRWDYHPQSGRVLVHGGDLLSSYHAVTFAYSGNQQWIREYPHDAGGTPLYDSEIGLLGEYQPTPMCEGVLVCNTNTGRFILLGHRGHGGNPANWTVAPLNQYLPAIPRAAGYSTPVDQQSVANTPSAANGSAMEYNPTTRQWGLRTDINTYYGSGDPRNSTFSATEFGAYDPAGDRIIMWQGSIGGALATMNGGVLAVNATTGAAITYSCIYAGPADGKTPTERIAYRPIVVPSKGKVFWYDPGQNRDPTAGTPWPVIVYYCNLADMTGAGGYINMYQLAALWPTMVPSCIVSEQDMIYVPTENALLIFGNPYYPHMSGVYETNNIEPPQANPESYFVDVDTGALRAGPPLPRDQQGQPWWPNNVLYHTPTDEIVAFGNISFGDSTHDYTGVKQTLDNHHVVYKRSTNLPSWASALPLYQWYAIPNTSIRTVDPASAPLPIQYNGGFPAACSAKVDAWNSFSLRKRGSWLYSAANGGHGDYSGNEVDCICLNAEVPAWREMRTATVDAPQNTFYYPDGRPTSRHSYTSPHYIESQNRIFLIGCGSGWGSLSILSRKTDAFSLERNDWDTAATWPDHPTHGGVTPGTIMAQHQDTDDVYILHPGTGALSRFTAATGTYTTIVGSSALLGSEGMGLIDPVRNRFVRLGTDHGWTSRNAVVNLTTGAVTAVTLTGPAASLVDLGSSFQSYGLAYDVVNDAYLCKPSNHATRLIRINPTTWYCEEITTTLAGGSASPPLPGTGTIYHRFRYLPEMRAVAYMPLGGTTDLMYFMRVSV